MRKPFYLKSCLRLSAMMLLLTLISGCVTTVDSPFNRKASEEKAVQSHIQLGLAYIQDGDYVTARQRLDRALEINPKSAGAHAALGLVFQRQGEPELAEASFKKALSYDAGYTRGRTYYAAFLYERDRFEEAAKQLELAGEDTTFSDRAQVFSNLGMTYARLERPEKALEAYQRSISLSRAPQANVVLAISQLHQMLGNDDLAWRRYSQFLDLVRQGNGNHSPGSLRLGIELAKKQGERDVQASLELLLRNRFPSASGNTTQQSKP